MIQSDFYVFLHEKHSGKVLCTRLKLEYIGSALPAKGSDNVCSIYFNKIILILLKWINIGPLYRRIEKKSVINKKPQKE